MKRIILLCSLLALAACVPPPPPPPGPPPVPMAVPPPGRVFTVFFDWNRSSVGQPGVAILQQAAAVYRAGGTVAVQVTGYTDTSGSPVYNQRLSKRRAYHVAHILAHMGVPWKAMTIAGQGANNLAVPTPPGVRDPRNRRVTVIE
jgi:OmpA-OmpF porin, OOP family